ncbi:MAG: antitoxin [Atopobiaceae bacterium]|nr:antitoxin [Atopobiaceae bacterium]
MATALTAIRAPEEVMERYTRLAQGTGRSRSFYINEALEESIDRLEYEYGILRKVEDWRAGRLETVSLDELEDSLGLAD